ncbi:hypothetical protein R3P38DRAFT_2932206 [Favolaschia claudopus]|uniref:Uncharacterized protein n=1 Tax=Favolaschia claudopus TaxID=2862362 RepID=A0AAW0BX75_9AGAR
MHSFHVLCILAVLAVHGLEVDAVQLKNMNSRANDGIQTACDSGAVVGSLTLSAITLVDSIRTDDQTVKNDLAALKWVLTATDNFGQQVLQACENAGTTNSNLNGNSNANNPNENSNNNSKATSTNSATKVTATQSNNKSRNNAAIVARAGNNDFQTVCDNASVAGSLVGSAVTLAGAIKTNDQTVTKDLEALKGVLNATINFGKQVAQVCQTAGLVKN